MTSRLLPRSDWHRLTGTLLGSTWNVLPETSKVTVVEDADGAIVACAVVLPVWHQEGVWIAPEHRGRVSVSRPLLAGMRAALEMVGASEVYMMAVDASAARMAAHFGPSVKLDAQHFAVRVEDEHGV